MPPEHGALINGVVRQSTLRTHDQCPMRAVHEARTFSDWTTGPAALGTAAHLVFEEILRTLRQTGEEEIPTEEALVIMRETLSKPECPHLSVAQMRDLRVLTLQIAALRWRASRIIGIEERLVCDVPCPDGKTRRITGQPDVIVAQPPSGATVLDLKTSWAVPPTPRDGDYSRDSGRPYLSERGTFQLDTLGVLVMRNMAAVRHVELLEYYPRLNEFRRATLERDELEHVEQRLGALAQRFEMAMAGEVEPEPRPGKWCSHCPIARECPVPAGGREPGTIHDAETANAEAARFVVVDALRNDMRAALKAFYEQTGRPPEVGDGTAAFWREKPNGKGREFGIFDLDEAPRPPSDEELMAQLEASVAQAKAERGT